LKFLQMCKMEISRLLKVLQMCKMDINGLFKFLQMWHWWTIECNIGHRWIISDCQSIWWIWCYIWVDLVYILFLIIIKIVWTHCQLFHFYICCFQFSH
jgi:hypothetical protein